MTRVDLVVIGGGPAGHAAALRARELEASVVLIEEAQLGGACVHHACIPTTILLDTLEGVTRARELGFAGVIDVGDEVYWNRAVARKAALVAAMAAGIGLQLRARGVEQVAGRARLEPASGASPQVRVALTDGGERTYQPVAGVIVATGATPRLPVIPGLPTADILWADAALRLPARPDSVALLSGGGAGATFVLETAQIFAAAGARVTLIAPEPALLPGAEPALAAVLAGMLAEGGIEILTGYRFLTGGREGAGYRLTVAGQDGTRELSVACLIAPDCRVPRTEGLGLEALGVALRREDGAVMVDERCATRAAGVFAAGDVTGMPMFSHVAAHQGRVAAEAALGERTRVDLRVLPSVVSTQPELAWVGLTEAAALARGRAVRVGTADLVANARALTMGQRQGLVRLVVDAHTGQILGAHALAPGASELIGQAALAMRLEATAEDLATAALWHPTLGEALVEAARRAL